MMGWQHGSRFVLNIGGTTSGDWGRKAPLAWLKVAPSHNGGPGYYPRKKFGKCHYVFKIVHFRANYTVSQKRVPP